MTIDGTTVSVFVAVLQLLNTFVLSELKDRIKRLEDQYFKKGEPR